MQVFSALALLIGCASTQLEVGTHDPADPTEAAAPLPPVGRALDADFDPLTPDAAPSREDSNPSHEPEHQTTQEHVTQPRHEHSKQEHGGSEPDATPGTSDRAEHPQGTHANDAKATAKQWTCTMHPRVITSQPGKCPICGMKLVPVAPKAPSGSTP